MKNALVVEESKISFVELNKENLLQNKQKRISEEDFVMPEKFTEKKIKKIHAENSMDIIPKKLVNGRWTKEENKRFTEALSKFGHNWKKVESYVGTRTGTQIRSHAQKYFLKTNKAVIENNSDSATQSVHAAKEPDHPSPNDDIPEMPIKSKSIVEILNKEEKDKIEVERLETLNNQALVRLNDFTYTASNAEAKLVDLEEEFCSILHGASELLLRVKGDLMKRCKKITEINEFELEEIDKCLKGYKNSKEVRRAKLECPYLVECLSIFGFKTFDEIKEKYVKLSDWVNVKSGSIAKGL